MARMSRVDYKMSSNITKDSGITRSASKVALMTMLSRILGYLRDAVVASYMGTGIYNDIFIAAFKLTNLFRNIFAEGAFNLAFLPIFVEYFSKYGKFRSEKFAFKVQKYLLLSLVVFTSVLLLFMPEVIAVTTPGFSSNKEILYAAVEIARIMFPYLFLISITAFYGTLLNSKKIFMPYAATPVILNLCIILFMLFINICSTPAHTMAYAVLTAGGLELIWMLLWMRYFDINIIHYSATKFRDVTKDLTIQQDRKIDDIQYLKKIFKRFCPAIIASGITHLNVWSDMILISFIPGGMSFIYYADRVAQLPLAVIGTALGTVLLPQVAAAFVIINTTENNITADCGAVEQGLVNNQVKKRVSDLQNHSLKLAWCFAIPSAIGLFILSERIVHVLFCRGEFDIISVEGTASVLSILAIGIPAFVGLKVTGAIFYGCGDTKAPVRLSLISLIVNVLLGLLLLPYYKHVGVAIASVCAGYLNLILAFIVIRKSHNFKLYISIFFDIAKFIASGTIMGAIIWIIKGYIDIISLIFIGFMIYMLSLMLFYLKKVGKYMSARV